MARESITSICDMINDLSAERSAMRAERVDSQNVGIHMVERSPKIPIGARPPDARRQPRRGTTHCVFVVRLKFK